MLSRVIVVNGRVSYYSVRIVWFVCLIVFLFKDLVNFVEMFCYVVKVGWWFK